MSSMSLPVSRKRLRSPGYRESDQSDSEVEADVPPTKIRRKYAHRIIPSSIKERLQSLADWMSDFGVKRFFAMAIKSGTDLQQEIILDDDDDESEEDTEVQEVTQIDPEKLVPLIEKFEQKLNSKRHNGCTIKSRYDTYAVNGSSSSDWTTKYSGIRDYSSRESRTDSLKRSAVVTNPGTDIEILLGAKPKVAVPESDEIEILSEMPSTKPKHSSSAKLLRISRSSSVKGSTSGAGSSNSSSLKRPQSSATKGFTANEVVRLHEKAQYKLLLEKYISESHYQHIVKKPDSMDVGVQANLKFSGAHFKKEVLQQPINEYFERYYKPCQLTKPDEAEQTSEKVPPEIKIDDDDDDDLKILEVRLPEFKPKIRTRKYFSPEWLSDLRSSVHAQTEERLKIVEEHEKQLERYRKERILKRLTVDHDIQPVEPEFPELTPEMEEAVERALSVGPPNEPLSGDLLRKDFETLGGLNWLNDSVINTYLELIVARSKQEGYPSIHAFNTFFYSNYKLKGYAGIQRWTRKLDIFSFDLNFVPIHLGVHWCLAVIDHRVKKVCYYDSMGNGEEHCLDLLHDYLCSEFKNKKGAYLDPSIYTKETMKDIPQQMNGSDCGMFTLKYADYVSRDAEITFNQGHMQYFRRRTIYELLKRQLL